MGHTLQANGTHGATDSAGYARGNTGIRSGLLRRGRRYSNRHDSADSYSHACQHYGSPGRNS